MCVVIILHIHVWNKTMSGHDVTFSNIKTWCNIWNVMALWNLTNCLTWSTHSGDFRKRKSWAIKYMQHIIAMLVTENWVSKINVYLGVKFCDFFPLKTCSIRVLKKKRKKRSEFFKNIKYSAHWSVFTVSLNSKCLKTPANAHNVN